MIKALKQSLYKHIQDWKPLCKLCLKMKVHVAHCFRGVKDKIWNKMTYFSSERYRAFTAEIKLCIGVSVLFNTHRAIYLANQLSSMQLCQQNKKKQNILNVSKQYWNGSKHRKKTFRVKCMLLLKRERNAI